MTNLATIFKASTDKILQSVTKMQQPLIKTINYLKLDYVLWTEEFHKKLDQKTKLEYYTRRRNNLHNKRFPSCLLPLCQNESPCGTTHMKLCSTYNFTSMKIKLIII